ncbi:amine sulfotransferase isoform X2 [Amia ocellicauda]|uniref:amine sulfotransferase isoform X2 n=1 Tax=Amia ocellicauda TaxID=2972642 RepID=UPI00346449A7
MADKQETSKLFKYKGFNFISNVHDEKFLDTLENFEIHESDICSVTYPKSGTVWMQYILSLMFYSDEVTGEKAKMTTEVCPWIEVYTKKFDYNKFPSQRLFVSHLPWDLIPDGLRKRGKVIYLARNPKDVAVSYYHFHKYIACLESEENFDTFLDRFLEGNVFGSSWFDHIKDWYSHKDQFDFLFLTYEEMKKDLRSTIVKISNFVGKKLEDKTIDMIVEKGTFKRMQNNPIANYKSLCKIHLNSSEGTFLRKGNVGDWKHIHSGTRREILCNLLEQNEGFYSRSFLGNF